MNNIIQAVFKMLRTYCCTDTMYIFILLVQCLPHGTIVAGVEAKNETSESVTLALPLSQITYVKDLTKEQAKYFQNLIYILNELQYFKVDDNKSGCFSLKQIERDFSNHGPTSKQIGIHLYFDENDASIDKSLGFTQNTKETNSDGYISARVLAGDCNTLPATFHDDVGHHGLDKLSRKQDDGSAGDTNDKTVKDNNTEPVAVVPQGTEQRGGDEDDKQKGLSRTQVIVIATCSAVIGTFFIIAGAMRVHSCLKRYRENRENILGIGRRTRGFTDTGSIRRESATSKASRQSHPASKAGSDSQINRNGRSPPSLSHNSPQHSSDQNQLLPVHAVGQLSDGSSSHGSLAYIDEETYSKTKASSHNSGSEYGSEDDPLLRKSPDSGSSVDVNLGDDDYEEKNECSTSQYTGVTSCGVTSCSSSKIDDITPSRVDGFEPCNEVDCADIVNEKINNNDVVVSFENTSLEEPCRKLESSLENRNYLIDTNNTPNDIEPDDNLSNDESRETPSELENFISKRKTSVTSDTGNIITVTNKKLPKKQFSVDYFDVDDNGVEIINPIFEESSEELSSLSENMAITVGLTQSDSSLSNNPSYTYGNQTAYEADPGYGQHGYCNPYVYDTNFHLNGPYLIRNTLRNSVLLSSENLRRANGDSLSTAVSCEDSYPNDSCRRESINDEFNRSKVSRMLSTDSYFTKAKRPLQAELSSPPIDGASDSQSTAGTMKLHIVPLAEYHRNSLKESIEDDNEKV